MRPKLTADPRRADALFGRLERAGQAAASVGMARLALEGEAYARELLTRLVYLTPERGGYRRTGDLRARVRAFAVPNGRGRTTIYLVALMPYSVFVERGTLEQRLEPDDILRLAQGTPDELILLELGGPGRGLEPRPFLYPSWVWMSRNLPEEVYAALRAAL